MKNPGDPIRSLRSWSATVVPGCGRCRRSCRRSATCAALVPATGAVDVRCPTGQRARRRHRLLGSIDHAHLGCAGLGPAGPWRAAVGRRGTPHRPTAADGPRSVVGGGCVGRGGVDADLRVPAGLQPEDPRADRHGSHCDTTHGSGEGPAGVAQHAGRRGRPAPRSRRRPPPRPGFPPEGPQLGRLVHDPRPPPLGTRTSSSTPTAGGTARSPGSGRPACATRWPVVAGARHREAAGLPRHLPAVAADGEVVRRSA